MKIFNFTAVIVCLGVVALLSNDVFAQGGRGGGRGMRMTGLAGLMAENEKVQEELKLEEEQIEKIKEFSDAQRAEIQEKMQEARDSGDFSGMQEMFAEMQKEAAKAEAETMNEVLNEDQLNRYKQLVIQQKGVAALLDDSVAEQVGLSDDDKSSIQDAMDNSQEKMREALQEMRDSGDREGMQAVMRESEEELKEEIMGLLSDEQTKKFAEIQGEAFEFPRPQGRGRDRRQDF